MVSGGGVTEIKNQRCANQGADKAACEAAVDAAYKKAGENDSGFEKVDSDLYTACSTNNQYEISRNKCVWSNLQAGNNSRRKLGDKSVGAALDAVKMNGGGGDPATKVELSVKLTPLAGPKNPVQADLNGSFSQTFNRSGLVPLKLNGSAEYQYIPNYGTTESEAAIRRAPPAEGGTDNVTASAIQLYLEGQLKTPFDFAALTLAVGMMHRNQEYVSTFLGARLGAKLGPLQPWLDLGLDEFGVVNKYDHKDPARKGPFGSGKGGRALGGGVDFDVSTESKEGFVRGAGLKLRGYVNKAGTKADEGTPDIVGGKLTLPLTLALTDKVSVKNEFSYTLARATPTHMSEGSPASEGWSYSVTPLKLSIDLASLVSGLSVEGAYVYRHGTPGGGSFNCLDSDAGGITAVADRCVGQVAHLFSGTLNYLVPDSNVTVNGGPVFNIYKEMTDVGGNGFFDFGGGETTRSLKHYGVMLGATYAYEPKK